VVYHKDIRCEARDCTHNAWNENRKQYECGLMVQKGERELPELNHQGVCAFYSWEEDKRVKGVEDG